MGPCSCLPSGPTFANQRRKTMTDQNVYQRLDAVKAAHEETLEAERKLHRDKAAEGEGTIARMEHDLKEASAEEERCETLAASP